MKRRSFLEIVVIVFHLLFKKKEKLPGFDSNDPVQPMTIYNSVYKPRRDR